MDRFIMTTHTTLSAARRAGWMDRPGVARVFRRQTPTQTTALLIANLELELIVSDRKFGLLRIPNRKKIAISLSTKWHRHSCLCVLARPGTRPTEAVTSLPSSFQNLIETPRLEFPATTTKLSALLISNRDRIGTFIVAAIPPASLRNLALRRSRPKTFSASTPCARLCPAVLQRRKFFCNHC